MILLLFIDLLMAWDFIDLFVYLFTYLINLQSGQVVTFMLGQVVDFNMYTFICIHLIYINIYTQLILLLYIIHFILFTFHNFIFI